MGTGGGNCYERRRGMKGSDVLAMVFGVIVMLAGICLSFAGEVRLPMVLAICGAGLFIGGTILARK